MYITSITDRHSFNEAEALVAQFGDDAVVEAASIADTHRLSGDNSSFARWRQVERAILMLQLVDVIGEVH